MTSTTESSGSLIVRNKHYVFDNKLKTFPTGWDCPSEPGKWVHVLPSEFPSLKIFGVLASVAYVDHPVDTNQDELLVDGFEFLCVARNSNIRNGYYGVAYVNKGRRQVVLSHRGTKLGTAGALLADLNGILRKNFVPQVSSAMTFAHKIIQYALNRDYQVFYTGHSLGGWLAQITTFSTMFLTLEEVTGHFVEKLGRTLDVQMPFTVVFDSPGAYEFLSLLKKTLFLRQLESTQEIHVETLPIEVYLFHPNLINSVNLQIGRLFILDLKKIGINTGKYFGAGTHTMKPVVRLLSDLVEEDAVKWQVIDYRVGIKDVARNSWKEKERTVPWNKSSVPLYFFSREERRFLEGATRDFPPGGQFEGVNWADEQISNDLMALTDLGEFPWELTGGVQSVVNCGGWDRKEFIPRVRHIVRCFRHRGTLWWNPNKSHLPLNYVSRRMCPTGQNGDNVRIFSVQEVLNDPKSLVLFVDPPGFGKSAAMTKLEVELRSKVSEIPRVIVRLNLNQFQHILETTSVETSISHSRFLESFATYIPVNQLQHTFPSASLELYLILDGLDEVCPLYERIMLHLLRGILSEDVQSLFSVHKVILTTRPHLQILIEDHFSVKANSLVPFNLEEQSTFLQKEVGFSFNTQQSLNSLPDPARTLMEIPLMLSLYAQVLKFHGAEGVVNIFDLYAQFMEAKHELHVLEKLGAGLANQATKRVMSSMLEDNFKFYYACAVSVMLGPEETFRKMNSHLEEGFLEQPKGQKLEEVISYGILVSSQDGAVDFKHRSFAEFFYAKLLTDDVRTSKEFRNVMFGRMYGAFEATNVENFVRGNLLKRQETRTGNKSPSSLRSPGLLREDEASLYMGKERLERLVETWLDSVKDKGIALRNLFQDLLRHEGHGGGMKYSKETYFNNERLQNISRDIFQSTSDVETAALKKFFNGNLFPFLCGWKLVHSLDYSDPALLSTLKDDTIQCGNFARWLCSFEDRRWARVNAFRLESESVANVWELIMCIAVRTDDICKLLSHEEISGALNSFHSVVYIGWRLREMGMGRVRKTLEKFVEPETLKQSLSSFLRNCEWKWVVRDVEMAWWIAEVFSRQELVSLFKKEVREAGEILRISPTTLKRAWGVVFVPRWKDVVKWKDVKGEGGWENVLWDEMDSGEIDEDLWQKLSVFGDPFGWQVLESLEKRVIKSNSFWTSTDPLESILDQLFASKDVRGGVDINLEAFMYQMKDTDDEESNLWAWLPYFIRYSECNDAIKTILNRLVSFKRTQQQFESVCRSFFLAYLCPSKTPSSALSLIRSFMKRLETGNDWLLNILLHTNEEELRKVIKENSGERPVLTNSVPIWGILISLVDKRVGGLKDSGTWLTSVDSPWTPDAETVARVLMELIHTSQPSHVFKHLKQLADLVSPHLLRAALLSEPAMWRMTETTAGISCGLNAAIRLYLFVFKEDLQWATQPVHTFFDVFVFEKIPVEILNVLEDVKETREEIFPLQPIETRIGLVTLLEKKLRDRILKEHWTLVGFAERYSYETEAEWERLLQALGMINLVPVGVIGCLSTSEDDRKRGNSIVPLIHVWIKHFGIEETRKAAKKQKLWEWLRKSEDVPKAEFLHAAVTVGSLEGVVSLAWPGLLKQKNKCGQTAGEIAVEIWGDDHRISKYLNERFQEAKIFQE